MKFIAAMLLLSVGITHGEIAAQEVQRASHVDSARVLRAAADSTVAFLQSWRTVWLADQSSGRKADNFVRLGYGHCHSTGFMPVPIRTAIIKGDSTGLGFCPAWSLGTPPIPGDEASSIDDALLPLHRGEMAKRRLQLLAQLRDAAVTLPGDEWIVGQRIRFLIDEHQNEEALRVARECRAVAWWCSALSGYVLQRNNQYRAADSAFTAASAAMTSALRCSWNDIRVLLPTEVRNKYAMSTCAVRDSLAERYWWMSDPLLSVAGNERRSEHFARKVLVTLHGALDEDERYHYTRSRGGDAIEEMLVRYGWPNVATWLGSSEDHEHDRWLKDHYRAVPAAPYSTAEYTPTRVHFAPSWTALADPFHAMSQDWEVTTPNELYTTMPALTPAAMRIPVWWPFEHMQYDAQLVQIQPGQTALFRRTHDVQIANATNFEPVAKTTLNSLTDAAAIVSLAISPAPDSAIVVSDTTASFQNRVALVTNIPSAPALVGVEVRASAPHGTVARARFGITPPRMLSAQHDGDVAISDIAFFVPSADGALPTSVRTLLPLMLRGTTIARGDKVGIYWENYGADASDSVRFSVTATLTSGKTLLQRLGSALKLTDAAVGSITASWNDANREVGERPVRKAEAILPRSMVLDVSKLPKGAFSIQVELSARGHEPVNSSRTLTIR